MYTVQCAEHSLGCVHQVQDSIPNALTFTIFLLSTPYAENTQIRNSEQLLLDTYPKMCCYFLQVGGVINHMKFKAELDSLSPLPT